jgi:hypothetical protein
VEEQLAERIDILFGTEILRDGESADCEDDSDVEDPPAE